MRGACRKFATGDSLSPIDRGDGNVMAKLGDVCTIVSGTTPKTSVSEYWDGDINWITPAELNEDTVVINESKRKITKAGVNSCGLSPFPAGTVILSSRAPIGKTAIAGTEMYCNQGFKNLICSDKIHNKYLFWFLRSKTEMLNSLGRGATFKEISKSIVENIEIPLPDISEQRRIADTLDKVSEGIEVCRKMVDELDLMVKAKFVEMFGDPVSNPMGWEEKKLGHVCKKLTDGTHFSPESFATGAYKYVTAKNIRINGFDFSNITYIPEEVHRPIYERCNPEYGDVLYIKDGVTTGIAMVNTLHEEFSLLSSVALLKQDRNVINGCFLCGVLNNAEMYSNIRMNMGGAAITRLTIAKLNEIRVIVPPIELQEQFATFVSKIDKSRLTIQQVLSKMEMVKLALMQEYFG